MHWEKTKQATVARVLAMPQLVLDPRLSSQQRRCRAAPRRAAPSLLGLLFRNLQLLLRAAESQPLTSYCCLATGSGAVEKQAMADSLGSKSRARPC